MIPQTDRAIDHVLTALGDTPAPAGLEARIAHRLLQAQNAPAHPATNPSLAARAAAKFFAAKESFAVILEPKAPHILLATALAVAIAIPHLRHDQLIAGKLEAGSWQAESQLQTTSTAPTPNTVILSGVSRGFMRETQPKDLPAARIPTTAQALSAPIPAVLKDDPDAIALAETLAPSHPIPLQPLTAEEHVLQSATRRTKPLELAELEPVREPFHRVTSHAREQLTFAQIAKGLLAPLAAAESFAPSTPSPEGPPNAQPDATTEPPPPR